MIGRIGVLLGIAFVLGGLANAVSPRGLSWKEPLGQDLRSQVAAAGFTPVSLAEMQVVFATGSATLIDARPAEEFRTGRIKGALSLPWHDVDSGRSGTLPPRGKPVVVYCANEFCIDGLRLAQWLDGQGFKEVGVFVDGYDAWWNGGKGVVDQD
jgi:rhodanese-related sulfurtransferase